jgi:hypothetical protein
MASGDAATMAGDAAAAVQVTAADLEVRQAGSNALRLAACGADAAALNTSRKSAAAAPIFLVRQASIHQQTMGPNRQRPLSNLNINRQP